MANEHPCFFDAMKKDKATHSAKGATIRKHNVTHSRPSVEVRKLDFQGMTFPFVLTGIESSGRRRSLLSQLFLWHVLTSRKRGL